MNDDKWLEASRQQIAEFEKTLAEFEQAIDMEGRARAMGFDLKATLAAIERVVADAPPQAREQAMKMLEEEEAQERAARAEAVRALSRSGGQATETAPAVIRRPRRMV